MMTTPITTPPNRHKFTIVYGTNAPATTWLFDGEVGPEICDVRMGDEIEFAFSGPGTVTQVAVLTGEMVSGEGAGPFAGLLGNYGLPPNKVLTVEAEPSQTWGFSVAFCAFVDQQPQFYFVPDPELQVGSIP